MDRLGEERALGLNRGWKHTYEPHSCRHCDWIVLDEADLKAGEGLRGHQLSSLSNVYLADSISDALLARDEGCPLFEYLLGELIDLGLSLDILDLDGSKTVYGSLTDRGLKLSHKLDGDKGIALANILKVILSSGKPSESLDCDPGSPEAFQLSRDWISTCLSSHPRCRLPPSSSNSDAFTPTRLLQVSEHGVRLVESSSVGDEAQTWCALSYVWGGDQPVKTTKKTLAAHYKGIPFDELPRTIQDAVRVCRGLAIRYLWLDALCIIQGDEQDLKRELGKMPEIYLHATITISAAWSTKADDGFLYRRGHWYRFCPPVKLQVLSQTRQGSMSESGEEEEEERRVETMEAYAYETRVWESDPINSRAWTYQEYALSQRALLYRSTLLEWSCRTISDSYGLLEPTTLTSKAAQQPDSNSELNPFFALSSSRPWSEVVGEYSSRHLSFSADKLRALSAIAQVYHRETGKEYLAGLWREDLPLALCWFAVPKTSSRTSTNENSNLDPEDYPRILQARPAGYRAPSWSWASIDDATFVYPAAGEETIQVLRPVPSLNILKAVVTPGSFGEFDSVASGYLDIEGPMREVSSFSSAARLMWSNSPPPGGSGFASGYDEIGVPVGEQGHEVVVTLDAAPEEEKAADGVDKHGSDRTGIWLLLLAEQVEEEEEEEEEEDDEGQNKVNKNTITTPAYAGLVLQELGPDQPDTLRRIGFFHCCDVSQMGLGHASDGCRELLKEFEVRRVTLV
ncbi:heterokaryon incompatibility protein-domain-containing protein [Pseudoneurospora amorphoporcata]|uniref:Heterokaryon incompatibility protein-domain-containing protein n=1 Tax=Pseudoneurospora amorphoporcata TaxID=241081 RepID=A0AAN6NNH7_9PEZI|nr:heterokaryon incompatibility protein-domain-containing protein [Pseudoneurospora amorphoporcata]